MPQRGRVKCMNQQQSEVAAGVAVLPQSGRCCAKAGACCATASGCCAPTGGCCTKAGGCYSIAAVAALWPTRRPVWLLLHGVRGTGNGTSGVDSAGPNKMIVTRAGRGDARLQGTPRGGILLHGTMPSTDTGDDGIERADSESDMTL